MSPKDSFEVLPDKPSDDEKFERGELKRFTANTNSNKSLIISNMQQESYSNYGTSKKS